MSWRLPSRLGRSSSSRPPQPRQPHLLSRRLSSSETSAEGSSKPGGSAKLLRRQQLLLLLRAQTAMRLPSLGRQKTPCGDGSSVSPVAALLTRAEMALHSLQKVDTQMQWGGPLTMQGCRKGAQPLLHRDPTEARAGPAPRMWLPLV